MTTSGPRRYRTIVADPPWRTQTGPAGGGMGEGFVGGDGRSRPLSYPTMTLMEISCLPVHRWAADDCALYLWTTNGYLPHAFGVARRWGFRYSTTLVWTKAPMGSGLGGAWGISTEYVIYARKGSPVEKVKHPSTWYGWKRPYDKRGKPKHSGKSPALQDLIEQMHDGPYLELFARENRLGWDTWGNESLEHVDLTLPSTVSSHAS